MSNRLWVLVSISYFLFFAESKVFAVQTEMATQTISEEKLFSDHPPMNFTTSRNAPLVNDKNEVLKFKLDYDEQKLVQENMATKESQSMYPLHRFSLTPGQYFYTTTYAYTGTASAITKKDLTSSSSQIGRAHV